MNTVQVDSFSIAVYCLFFLLLSLGSIHGKKRWKQRGIVTGFITALYAEMWGFPLSLFVITSLSGERGLPYQFDNLMYYFVQPRIAGDVAFSNPALAFRVEYILARGLALLSLFPIIYGWFYLEKNVKNGLVTDGPYAYSRNPQYIGFVLFVVGMTLYWPTLITVPMGAVLCLAYYKLAINEEKDLRETYGKTYQEYARKVPRFLGKETFKIFRLPKLRNFAEILVAAAIIIPFILWFGEAFVAWGLGMESLISSFWAPIAYFFPIHIGVVVSIILFIIAGLATVVKRYTEKTKPLMR